MAINASQGALALGVLTLLFGGDILTLLSGTGVSPQQESAAPQKDVLSEGGKVHISFCTSWSYKGAFMQARQVLMQQFPDMEVLGTGYPVPPHKAFMAKVMMVAQYGSIGLLLGGEQLFAALGMPVPELYQQYRDKRTGIVLGIWLLGNALQNQLVSTGAFEVYYDGERVFSKLESGRVPSIDELIDLLETAKGLPPSFEQRSRI